MWEEFLQDLTEFYQKDFETLFQMIYGYFTNLNYDEASYNSYKAKQQGF